MHFRPSGPCPAKIMIVGEAPGEQEVREGTPFVGTSGQELSRMLQEAGIMRSACFLTNVARTRPLGNDIGEFIALRKADITSRHVQVRDRWVIDHLRSDVDLLRREIEMCRPNVIIAFGNVALWALTGQWGITSWRGSALQCDLELALEYRPKVIPTYHPAAILRQWSWRPVALHDLRRAAVHSQTPEIIRADYRFIIRPDFATARDTLQLLLRALDKGTKLAIDIETRAGHIACIGIAWSKREAICIPLMSVQQPAGYWPFEEELELQYLIMLVLTHANCEGVGQNFSYDAQYFHRHLCYVPRIARDTMLGQHSCFSNMPKGLDFLSSMYCEDHVYWKGEGKNWDPSIPEDQLWTYNCKDAVITYEVDTVIQENVDKMGLRPVDDFQQSLFYPVLRTMNRGIRVDKNTRGTMAMMLFEEIAKREQWIIDVTGRALNPKSPKQMAEFFYEECKQKPVINRKTGSVSCDDESLRKVADREPLLRPIVNRIAELRSLGVFLSTFVNAPLDNDGRMRCSFNIAGTETYRFSSSQNAFGSGMNLQNIPKGGDAGSDGLELPNVRTLFIPDPGYVFFDIDLSSADPRIVAWESGEDELKQIFKEGKSPYIEVGREYFKDPTFSKQHKLYRTFKELVNGTHYLGTAKGVAERIGLTVADTDRAQKWYFGKFPKIKKWQEDVKDQLLKRHMVQNVFGYRQYYFDRIEGTIFNQAAAWIPQSTVACIINRAYVRLDREHPEVEVLLQVHDSLAGQFPRNRLEECKAAVLKCAEVVLPYDDPLIIPVGIMTSEKSWGDCR